MGHDRSNVTIGDQREKAEPRNPNKQTEVSGAASSAMGIRTGGKTCSAEIDARWTLRRQAWL